MRGLSDRTNVSEPSEINEEARPDLKRFGWKNQKTSHALFRAWDMRALINAPNRQINLVWFKARHDRNMLTLCRAGANKKAAASPVRASLRDQARR